MLKRLQLQSIVNVACLFTLIVGLVLPAGPVAAAPTPPATFTPPVESSFYGATQASVAGPLGLDVSIYDLSLRAVRTDMFLPGCAVPLQATFIYEAHHGDSSFGYGWRFVYAASYSVQGDGSLLIGPINGQMEQFTPGDGRLSRPQPGRYELFLNNGITYYFDDPGHKQVTKIAAQSGGYLTLAYEPNGQLTRITDHYGRHLNFSYAGGRLASITDANATPVRTTYYAYDPNGNLVSARDPLGNKTRYEFDFTHTLRKVTDSGGNWATINYTNELNKPTHFPDGVGQITTPLGAVSFSRVIVYKQLLGIMSDQVEFARDQATSFDRPIIANYATVTDIVNGQQRTTRYDFDWSGQIYSITDPLGHVTYMNRDANGNLTQLTDGNGAATSYMYNSAGQLLRIIDPLASVTSYTYDATGRVASVTDPLKRTTQYQYDSDGNLIRTTDPYSNTTSFAHDADGKLTSVTDPLSNTFSYTYDAYGFPASMRDGAGVTTTFSYNARGDLLQVTDGRSRTTTYDHDALGRVISVTHSTGQISRMAYNGNGSLAQLFDPAGRIVNYTYDVAGRPVKQADAQGAVNYTYDAAGNITAITDSQNHRETFSYDLNGRITGRNDGLTRPTTFKYDAAGNLTSRTDPISQTTVYTYSDANQLTGIGYPDGSTVAYTYDAAGNRLQESNANVTVNYTYDDANRLAKVTTAGKTISYTYDAAGRRASMTDPDGNKTTYSYDGASRLLSVTDPQAGAINYTYDAAGKLARLERANGVYSLYTYGAANRLQAITHYAPGGSVLDSFAYTYDQAGNRTSVISAENGTTTYTYDGRYQLTGVSYPDGTSTTYSYDLAGNRLMENGTAYNYDAADQLLNRGSTTYDWDVHGNQVGETTNGFDTSYSYDHENRLSGASFADGSRVKYGYYPDGRLFSRTDRAGQITHFYYDGPNLFLETDSGGDTLARYTNGLNLDAWLAMQRGGQSYDYLQDGLNSITGLTDSSGAMTASYQYDVYGGIRAETGSVPNPIRFTGRYWDPDAALYQYRARWYDPGTGRFLSRDPLGPINVSQMYAYATNNPTNYLDPLGLDTWSCNIRRLSGGLVLGGEYNKLTCYNPATKETCKLTQWCIKAGIVAGVQSSGCKSRIYNGPHKGSDFDDSNFGWTAGGAIGLGVTGIGAGGNIDTANLDPNKSSGSAGWAVCGGFGSYGAEAELGGQFCSTSVVSCTRPPEPKPRPTKPPYKPGDDHADDNFSAASRTLPISNNPFPLPNYPFLNQSPANDFIALVDRPRVGIFWHGYAEEAQALLASWGWASTPVDIDFTPSALDVPVLFVPSGGLYGLESAASIRARLEAFAADGGVIISLAQQHGYEFTSLPGGQLDGYGWAEDNSCFDASLYVSEYHPLLSGFSSPTLTAGVDGFFSDLPDGAQTLLNRSRDGQPGLTLYPFQSGWVVAASVYDDWGGANHQPPADSARLLRDLLSWGVDANGPLPEFSPAMTATMPVTIANDTLLDAARIRFTILDPEGQEFITQTLDLPVSAGGQIQQTIQQANLPSQLGIWWVQYTLLDSNENVVQPAVWGGRFAVSDPHAAAGPGKAMSLSITAPTEDFVPGPATFTFHVHNFTDSPRPATVAYGFPHHTWETGDPAYGDFYGLSQAIIVPPQSEITFTHTADIMTNDRLFARLYDATFSQNTWFQIRTAPAAVDVDLLMDADLYLRGQTAQVTASLTNLQSAAHQVTLNWRAKDSQGGILFQEQQIVALSAAAVVTTAVNFAVPPTAQLGTAVFSITAQDADGSNLNAANDSFTIPDSPLIFAAALPNTLSPGVAANLVVTATNNSSSLNVMTATLTAKITSPDSSVQSLPPQPFVLAAAQSMTLTVPFTVPPAQFGEYVFELRVVDEYGRHVWTIIDWNEPVISTRFDQSTYASGDLVKMEVTVENSGHWSQNLDLLIAPLLSASISIPLSLEPGEPASMTVEIPLPTGMTAGSYQFISTLIPPTGNTIANTASIMVPDADLRETLASRSLSAGIPISITIVNIGGVDTQAEYSAWLRDASGITIQTITGTLANVQAGGSGSFAFPVPDEAVSGSYVLGGALTNTQAGRVRSFTTVVTIDGSQAAIVVGTEQTIYTEGQPITATAQISNTGLFPINNATLNLAVDAPPDWTWFTHRPGQQGPANGASSIVTDTAGVKWMRTHRAINAFDDGGTPFDKSDDRWQVFDTLNGLPRPYPYRVFADAAGYKWISSGQGLGDTLSVLDDGGTPFDVTDDQWLHYTSADGYVGYVLAQDAAGNLWINYVSGGVSALDPGSDPMSKSDDTWAVFSTADGLADNSVSTIRVDAAGHKWFATNNGASVLDDGGDPFDGAGDTWHSFYEGSGLPDNRVNGMEIDANGRIWFAGGGISFAYDVILGVLDTGASPVDGAGDTFRTFAPPTSSLYGIVGGFSLDGNGRAWFGLPSNKIGILDTGADPLDGTGDTWGAITSPYQTGPPMVPAEGNANWLSSGSGLILFDHGSDPFDDTDDAWQLFSKNAGIGNYNISAIAPGEAGMTWLGSQANGPLGLRVLDPMGTSTDPSDDQWMSFHYDDGLPNDAVLAIALDQTGAVWVAAYQAAVLDHNGTPFDKTDDSWATLDVGLGGVYDLVVDAANRKWFTGWSNSNTYGLSVLDDGGTPITKTDDLTMTFPIAGMTSNDIDAIAIDQNGVKWMVTWAEAAALDDGGTPFNTGDDVTQVFPLYPTHPYPSDVAVDEQNNIWFAFNGNSDGVGILDYNGTLTDTGDDTWHYYNTGLVDNSVLGVAVDSRGDKWFATDKGLSRLDDGGDPFDGLNDTWESFITEVGMGYDPSPEVDVVAVGGDGNIWAGTWENGASVGVWQGTAVWSAQQPITTLPAAAATQIITGVSDLTSPGRYVLRGEFANAFGQTMATDRSPFYIVSGQTALTLDAAPDPVRPGGSLTITGALVNNSDGPVTNKTVLLYQDGTFIRSEGPFDVPAHSTHPFTITVTAPVSGDSIGFMAVSSGLSVDLNVVVGRPVIDASATSPAVVGSDPFTVTISLTNTGAIAGQVQLFVNNQQQTVTVPPGETVLAQATAQVCADTTLPVTLTGDLTQTLNVPVTFGQSLAAAFNPLPIYPPGVLAVPHTFTSAGQLDIAFTTAITVTDSHLTIDSSQFDAYIIASETITGSSAFDLPTGDYNLAYTLNAGGCSLAGGQESFAVAPANSVTISLTAGLPGTAVPLTVTVTNSGSGDFTGPLQLSTDYDYHVTQPVSLTVGASRVVTFTADVALATPGVHTATVTAITGAGINVRQATTPIDVLGPVLNVTTLPNQTTLPVSQTITLTFGVSNQGDQDGQAEFRFSFGDVEEDTQVRRIAAGDTEQFDVTFFIPSELEAKDYLTTYTLNGQQGELVFSIQGISLAVTVSANQAAYREDESVQLQLTVTNNQATMEPGLYALVSLDGNIQTRPFTLTTAPVDLTFPLTATFGNGGLVFYGIYHQATQRGIYLNTFRLPQQQRAATVLLDRQVYAPGDEVQATVVTTATGKLEITSPGYTASLPLSGSNSNFAFPLPNLMTRGSYAVNYRLTGCDCDEEGRMYQAVFDVDGPVVRVTESRLDKSTYLPGIGINLSLTLASDRSLNTILQSTLIYPDGRANPVWEQPATLLPRPNNLMTVTATISDTQAGLYLLSYTLVDAVDKSLIYATGVEAFDVGQASLLDILTDRSAYDTASDPVTANVQIYASQPVSGQLTLLLSGGGRQVETVNLSTGRQIITTSLNAPVSPGQRVLTATLWVDGLSSQAQTAFPYGVTLPDLRLDLPWVEAGGIVTRTLMALMSNEGKGATLTTTARFYDGDPNAGGVLIGTAVVPPVAENERVVVSVVWDIQGLGGEHVLYVTVDPTVEYDESNNVAQTIVSLPTFAAGLTTTPPNLIAGDDMTVNVHLTNLQASASLPVTVAVEILSPRGTIVHTQSWAITLSSGEEQWLNTVWSSEPTSPDGGYLVNLIVRDAAGNYKMDGAFTMLEPRIGYDVYLPVILKNQMGTDYHESKAFSRMSNSPPVAIKPLSSQVWNAGLSFLSLLLLLTVYRPVVFLPKETARAVTHQHE